MRTREEMEAEIRGLQQLLAATDYKALKHADGALTDEEYEPTRAQRAEYRKQINAELHSRLEQYETVAQNEKTAQLEEATGNMIGRLKAAGIFEEGGIL